jgi:anti-sigma-K factor RskA
MSQFTLTAEEGLLVLGAIRARAAQYLNSMGVNDPDLDALIDKFQSHFAPVVEEVIAETPPDVIEPTDEEVEAHFAEEVIEETSTRKKKAK